MSEHSGHLGNHDDHRALLRCVAGDAALCTIVGIEGSFSRRLGAQLAVGGGDDIVGSLADGCLENQLRSDVEEARRARSPRIVRFGKGSASLDYRLPCGSGIDIPVDPAPDRGECGKAVRELGQRNQATLRLPVPARSGLLCERHYIPPPKLILLGTGPETVALSSLASAYGLAVEVHGPFAGGKGLSLGREPTGIGCDPWSAVVLLFHDHEWETSLLTWALRCPAFYIGAQGGYTAREHRHAELRAAGIDETTLQRVKSPIGLIPRTRDPQVLALSVLADLVAEYQKLHPHDG